MNQLLQGHPLCVFGDGKQTRAFSYIGDIAPTIARSVELPEAAWVTQAGSHTTKQFENIEVTEKLPTSWLE